MTLITHELYGMGQISQNLTSYHTFYTYTHLKKKQNKKTHNNILNFMIQTLWQGNMFRKGRG